MTKNNSTLWVHCLLIFFCISMSVCASEPISYKDVTDEYKEILFSKFDKEYALSNISVTKNSVGELHGWLIGRPYKSSPNVCKLRKWELVYNKSATEGAKFEVSEKSAYFPELAFQVLPETDECSHNIEEYVHLGHQDFPPGLLVEINKQLRKSLSAIIKDGKLSKSVIDTYKWERLFISSDYEKGDREYLAAQIFIPENNAYVIFFMDFKEGYIHLRNYSFG